MGVIRSISPVARAIGLFSAVAVLATGVTFAVLNDSAQLTGNTLESDTADLDVSNGGSFGDSRIGFQPDDIVPGEGEVFDFFLKNGSDFDMNVEVAVPNQTCGDVNLSGVANCHDVLLTFTDTQSGDESTYTLQQLMNSPREVPGNVLTANSQGSVPANGHEGDFKIEFDFDPSGLSGSTATVDAFDLVFTGSQAT